MVSENIVRTVINIGQQPTEAQIREIEAASAKPVVPDEDAPELTMEQYAEMAAIARARKAKNIVTIQSPIRNPLRYLLMWLLAKEIFKNMLPQASLISIFYENCLGSE